MPPPTISDAQITTDAPFDTTLCTELRDYDDWNKTDATAGSGIAPSTDAMAVPFAVGGGHSHNGDPGHGVPINTDGIAAGAVFDPAMIPAGNVTNPKVSTSSPMPGRTFKNGSVTTEKFTGEMGSPAAFENKKNQTGPGGGLTADINHGLSRRPIVVNIKNHVNLGTPIEFEVILTNTSIVRVGVNPQNDVDPWSWSFDCL